MLVFLKLGEMSGSVGYLSESIGDEKNCQVWMGIAEWTAGGPF